MDAISIQNVSKHFRKATVGREFTTFKSELVRLFRRTKRAQRAPVTQALSEISLNIPKGKTFGLLGRNGSGKSTLLKLITGIYTPSSGSIHVNGRISALLDLGAGFHPDFSGRENILINGIILGLTRAEIRAKMAEIIEFSELGDFIDEPVRTYSSGMYMRLAFSVATHVDPEILIIDEILAVGDAHFSRKSRNKMEEFKRRGKTILLVSHDLGTVQSWCDGVAWLDKGRLRAVGDPREVVSLYTREVNKAELLAASHVPVTPAEGGSAELVSIDITAVKWLDDAGKERAEFRPDEKATFECDFIGMPSTGDLKLKISVHRDSGMPVWQGEVALPPGVARARLEFRTLPLGDGDYTLGASILTANNDALKVLEPISSVRIVSSATTASLVRLDHRWQFEDSQKPALQAVQGV